MNDNEFPSKRTIRYFISYTRDDGKIPDQFLNELRNQLGACVKYEFLPWRDTQIHPGEKWHEEIQQALDNCDFGLLLASPAFLGKHYITAHELPRFVSGAKPCIPVMLRQIDLENHDLCGLTPLQFFGYTPPRDVRPRSFQECTVSKHRTAFTVELFKRIVERLDKIFESHAAVVESVPQGLNPVIHKTKIINNLPRLQPFFGRDIERAQIREALDSENRTWGALIDGPGGIGKTSLAVQAAYDCSPAQFKRIIFISLKDRELDDDGVRPLTGALIPRFLEMLNELARELGQPTIPTAPENQRIRLLLETLRSEQALLILDNLESLPKADCDQLFSFLKRLPQSCKAILTSRDRIGSVAEEFTLDRLDQSAALATLDELARHNNLLKKTTKAERIALYKQTDGKPLLLRWLSGQLGRGSCRTLTGALEFLRSCPPDNNPLEFIFGDLLEEFTPEETRVLCALTYFTLPAKIEHIATLAANPQQQDDMQGQANHSFPNVSSDRYRVSPATLRSIGTALRHLTNRSIVISDQADKAFSLVPMVADFLRRSRPKIIAELSDHLEKLAYSLVMENGGEKYDRFNQLDLAWPLLEPALRIFLTRSPKRLSDICAELHTFLNFWGRWDERVVLCQEAEIVALEAGDPCAAGWRAYSVAVIHYSRGQKTELQHWLEKVEKHWSMEDTPRRERAYLERLLGLTHYLNANHREAIKCFQIALKILEKSDPKPTDIPLFLNALASAQIRVGDIATAKKNYGKAGKLSKEIHDDEGVANSLSKLAALALIENRWNVAEKLALEALPLAETVRRQALIAHVCHDLAKSLVRQGKNAEGIPYARRAIDIYTKLGSAHVEDARATLREFETL